MVYRDQGTRRASFVHRLADVHLPDLVFGEKSPSLKRYLDEGTVGLIGAMYDLGTSKVTFLDE